MSSGWGKPGKTGEAGRDGSGILPPLSALNPCPESMPVIPSDSHLATLWASDPGRQKRVAQRRWGVGDGMEHLHSPCSFSRLPTAAFPCEL